MRCIVTSVCLLAFAIAQSQARLSPSQLRKSLMAPPSFSHRRGHVQPQNRNIVLPVNEGPLGRPQTPPGQVNNQRSNRPIIPPGQVRNRQFSANTVSGGVAQNTRIQNPIRPTPVDFGTAQDNVLPMDTFRGPIGHSSSMSNRRPAPIIQPIRAGNPLKPQGANAVIESALANRKPTDVNTNVNMEPVKPIINDRIVDTVNQKSTPAVTSGITQTGMCQFNIPATLLPDPSMSEWQFNRTILVPTIMEYLNPNNRPCITDALKRYLHMLLRWREMAFRI